ncbi:hypothetical protein Q31a_24120 [Aureliella helgolandensis]|uniref:Uncharacterized protein n=1 Tax=Aureliella helgolandensis TaxID=2527968 RepID=A0A518G699_9BACT|nr:hypothetical protein Q31a_24120 [Aureliella helgolandensis]
MGSRCCSQWRKLLCLWPLSGNWGRLNLTLLGKEGEREQVHRRGSSTGGVGIHGYPLCAQLQTSHRRQFCLASAPPMLPQIAEQWAVVGAS